ncbi:MAG: type II/IV secretion system ATPase subunit [Methanosarcinaceae archaeon]|jgi:flagellar protein FlaI|nr:type II/IV secretion system ATPase subunit [Methanosarcinaceae archaeon]
MESNFNESIVRNPHLKEYLDNLENRGINKPEFKIQLSREMKLDKYPNILYPLGDPNFIHILGDEKKGEIKYIAIEPRLDDETNKKYKKIINCILENAPNENAPKNESELEDMVIKLYHSAIKRIGASPIENINKGFINFFFTKRVVYVTDIEYDTILHYIKRDILGNGPIDSIMCDPYLEDIHNIGIETVHVVHKIFGMLKTNIAFNSNEILDDWLRGMSERIGKSVNEDDSIIDGTLPDGSRINLVYDDSVSRKGSSFTICKYEKVPISIVQLIEWGTIDALLAAYIWICLENGMNVFFSGESSSGKTTMLNACLPFINKKHKIYSIEDTAEVRPPHPIWQQLITREKGNKDARVDTFTLLKAALRSRPKYIIVGEIRGSECSMAFQGMQTGHSVLATFHADSIKKLIQRFTGDPINIPKTFIDNLNVVVMLQAMYINGNITRRCINIDELEGFVKEADSVLTRTVFQWDNIKDKHIFGGIGCSFIIGDKIASKLGYENSRKAYEDLYLRANILHKMRKMNIMKYPDVLEIIWGFQEKGIDGLPFDMKSIN